MDPSVPVVYPEPLRDRVDGALQGADQAIGIGVIPPDAVKLDRHRQWGASVRAQGASYDR
jgi:hypothetical protein